jgi:hypothetical protein
MNDDSIQSSVPLEDEPITVAQQVRVRPDPRISAKQLAEYLISDDSRRTTIIREAKFAKTAIVVQYKKVRSFIPHAFKDNCLDINLLARRADEVEHEEAQNEWFKDDNKRSAEALRHLCEIAPSLNWENAHRVHIRDRYLAIGGVMVSINPELTFSFEHRNVQKSGGLMLNTTQNDGKTMARTTGQYCMGDYMATLLFKLLLANAAKIGAPVNKKCWAVDIFRKEAYTAPANFKKLDRNIESACLFIAARWKTMTQNNYSATPSRS